MTFNVGEKRSFVRRAALEYSDRVTYVCMH